MDFKRRIVKIREKIKEKEEEALIFFSPVNIRHLTGFNFIPTERPIALLITENNILITVPELEKRRARDNEFIDQVFTYYDYPGDNKGDYYQNDGVSPESKIEEMVNENSTEKIIADSAIPPSAYTRYDFPELEEYIDGKIEIEDLITEKRLQKSDEEIEQMRSNAEYCDWIFDKIRDIASPGTKESSLNFIMQKKASEKILENEKLGSTDAREAATFRIITGERTANAHEIVSDRKISEKDVILPGTSVKMGGYYVELERTMFIGKPEEKAKNMFEIMREARRIAEENIEAGVKASLPDQEVHRYFGEQGVLEHVEHHSGHGLGLELHEPPYIDRGNDRKLKENMVISIEPGLYVENIGGFRHSDTFLVKENGVERLTEDPRDLESNIIRKD